MWMEEFLEPEVRSRHPAEGDSDRLHDAAMGPADDGRDRRKRTRRKGKKER